MSDSWSSSTDAEVDLHSRADFLIELRDQVSVCIEKLNANGYSQAVAEEISKALLRVRQSLDGFECGVQFTKDLAVANQLVATQADHRSVDVIRFCLQHLSDYLSKISKSGVDHPTLLLAPFNELFALRKKPLLTEGFFYVPDEYRVYVDTLKPDDQTDAGDERSDRYLALSQCMLGVYRGEARDEKLVQLSESFQSLAVEVEDEKAKGFWLLCTAFTTAITVQKGELSPALFKIFKAIESVLFYALGDTKSPVLGMQQNVDKLLVNLLSYVYQPGAEKSTEVIEKNTRFSGVFAEIDLLAQSSTEQSLSESQSSQSSSLWLGSSISVLADRLQHCGTLLSEEALQGEESVAKLREEISVLRRLLVLLGVHGASENLEEVENYLHKPLTSEAMQACATSVQLVEQQMRYQFGALSESTDADPGSESPTVNTAVPDKILQSEFHSAEDFGTRCNLCIDVIQQALDTALGSSGNLIPDSSVVNALAKLIDIVSAEGIGELTNLLTPLSQLLTKASDSTLNQSDTLLIQEAIIAATLGIDALVGQKPMPDLVGDVTTRVAEVLETTNQRLSGSAPRNGALSGFLIEAEELLPRLFELFQRLRGAPDGASHLYGDINRLLHSFKYSADEAEVHDLAELAHYLESTMVDLTQSDARPSQGFFDLALESIECLGEDIELMRNGAEAEDRADLIDRLKIAGTVAEPHVAFQPLADATGLADDERMLTSASHSPGDGANQTGVIVLQGSTGPVAGINWPQRFRQVEACCDAIGNSHKQLLELQKKTEQLVQDVDNDKAQESAGSNTALQSLAEQLEQITTHQTTAVRQLERELGNASMLDVALLGQPMIDVVEQAADTCDKLVQFAFSSSVALLDKTMFEQLSASIGYLLSSIVAYALPDASDNASPDSASAGLATIKVDIQQDERTTIIEVTDDGCGVTIQGAKLRSDNPWMQVARPDWREVEHTRNGDVPQIWSKQIDHTIDIDGLLKVATRYGGTVAVRSDEDNTRYRLSLPVLSSTHDVLVFEVRDVLLAIRAASVENVGFTGDVAGPAAGPAAGDSKAISLGQLLGVKKRSAFDKSAEDQCIAVRTSAGLQQFSVNKIVGHKSLKFTASDRVLPDIPGYLGMSVAESGQLVMLLDIDYWNTQR